MFGHIFKFVRNITEQKWHQVIYNNLVIFSSIILILSLFGFSFINPKYEHIVRYIIQIYIGFFLILRFNPFIRLQKLSKLQRTFDRRIAFSAGIYILSTSIIFSIIEWIRLRSTKFIDTISHKKDYDLLSFHNMTSDS